jgi:hypothetical protein
MALILVAAGFMAALAWLNAPTRTAKRAATPAPQTLHVAQPAGSRPHSVTPAAPRASTPSVAASTPPPVAARTSAVPARPVASTVAPTPTAQSSTTTAGTSKATLPDPRSAGVVTGSTLTPVNGNVSLTNSNVTYSNASISGSLYITGDNVTVTNVKVAGDVMINNTPLGGVKYPVPSNIKLNNVTATSVFTVGFNGLTLNAVNLSYPRNAPQAQMYCYYDSTKKLMYPASNLVIENSWMHGFLPSTNSAHLENLHMACVHGATITNNEFDLFAPDTNTLDHMTANVTLDAEQFGAWNSNVVMRSNRIRGGSYYQLYFCSSGTTNEVSNNYFNSKNNPIFAGIQFPPSGYSASTLPNGTYTKFVDSGNKLNGTAVTLPGGQ